MILVTRTHRIVPGIVFAGFLVLASHLGLASARASNCVDYTRFVHHVVSIDPGPTIDLAVAGSIAYVAGDGHLSAIDLHAPGGPALAGQTGFPYGVRGLAVAGRYAYVANTGAGLRIVDLTDPLNPSPVGILDTPGEAFGVAVSGTIACIADNNAGVEIVDISDPFVPVMRGAIDTPGGALRAAIRGHHAYVADRFAGVQVIDIADPAAPFIAGVYDTPGEARDVVLDGDRLLVADADGGLLVLDLADPVSPTLLGAMDTPGRAYGVTLTGTTACVGDQSGGVSMIDVADPSVPRLLLRLAGGNPWDAVLADGFILSVGGAVEVFAVPSLARVEPLQTYTASGAVYDIVRSNLRAYVSGGEGGIAVLDIGGPRSPQELGRLVTSAPAGALALAGGLLCVTQGRGGLALVNVRDAAHPFVAGVLPTYSTWYETTDVAARGNTAYVYELTNMPWGGADRFEIVDVLDPTAPRIVDAWWVGGGIEGGGISDMAISGNRLYLLFAAWPAPTLGIYDISNPEAATLLGWVDFVEYPDYYSPTGITARDNLLYLTGDRALQILDLTDPAAPVARGRVPLRDAERAVLSGDFAYATGGAFLQVIDIADPDHPVLVGEAESLNGLGPTVLVDDVLWAPAGANGLELYPTHCPDAAAWTGLGGTGSANEGDAAARTLVAHPNPSRGATTLTFALAPSESGSLEIFGIAGRLVRRLDAVSGAGAPSVTWDGRDLDGNAAASGVYFARLTTGSRSAVARILLAR